jgi:ABC-type branched-subunit amino acid transport system substrate-binding protein
VIDQRTRRLGYAVAAAAVMLTAACSSSGKGSASAGNTSDGPGGGGGSKQPLKELKIGVLLPTNTPSSNDPDALAGARAAVSALNKAGGVAGYKFSIDYCNENSDANSALKCAHQLVSDGVVAADYTFSTSNAAGVFQILRAGHVASVAVTPLEEPSWTDASSFPIESGTLGALSACGRLGVAKLKANNVSGVAFDRPAAIHTYTIMANAAKASGGGAQVQAKPFLQPLPPAPYNPTSGVNAVKQYDLIGLALSEPAEIQFIQTARQLGVKNPVCSSVQGVTSADLVKLGPLASNVYVGSNLTPIDPNSSVPAIKQYLSEMTAAGKVGIPDTDQATRPGALIAWTGVQIIKQIVAKIGGSVTAEAFYNAISKATVSVPGITPTLDFGASPKKSAYPRIFNWNSELWNWNVTKKAWDVVDGPADMSASF